MPPLYGAIIMEHFRHPRNRGTLAAPDVAHEGVNPLCGDRIRIEIKLRDGTVEAARFRGDACAISVAAASLLTGMVEERPLSAAEAVSDDAMLAELGVRIQPARLECALLALNVLRVGIRKYRERAGARLRADGGGKRGSEQQSAQSAERKGDLLQDPESAS